MYTERLARLALRTAARRAPTFSISRSGPRALLVLQQYNPRLQFRHSTSSSKSSGAGRKQQLDDNLLKMDIDAIEKHTKEWFGDHASWDHEKLLKLLYGSANPNTSKILH